MKLSASGFTLVELLSAVAIVGILSAIAIPNYRKQQMRARQAEAKVSLGALYFTEQTVMQDQHSFTSCFGKIAGRPPGLDYYAVGFPDVAAEGTNCSPYGGGALNAPAASGGTTSNLCLNYAWVKVAADYVVAQSCDTNPGETYFAALIGGLTASPTVPADLVDLAAGTLTWNSFTARAAGNLGYASPDIWEIDENKSIHQVQSGLSD